MTLLPGTQLGPYEIEAEIGRGGMGVVYRARDPRLKRTVALKLLPPELTSDETAKQRFLQEAQSASALDHPHICTIHDVGETEAGQLYLVMAHYGGETLKDRIARGPLPVAEAVDIVTQVGRGLERAHAAGIVHRDIKPANLMVTPDGTVKILDFGLAKLAGSEGVTQTGTTVGTVAYMSPEQARGDEVDHRTDIWALGAVLYEMLSGRPPFAGENLLSLADAIRSRDPAPLTGEAATLDTTINRALRKETGRRYQTVTDLLSALGTTGGVFDASDAASKDPEVPSIAVLPFDDMSPARDQAYFCEGMAEEIIGALTEVEGLRVASRTSAARAKAKGLDIAEIGSQLNVGAVLEGSVRTAGSRLRVAAQLVSVGDGNYLWSQRYDRDLTDVFAVQDEIASTVVEKLKVKLLGDAEPTSVRRGTANLEAYTLYLQGRHHFKQATAAGLQRALECYERAVELDGRYAPAHAGVALTLLYMSLLWQALPADETMPRARSAAERALEIDPTLSEAHAALGAVSTQADYDPRAAEASFEEALRLNPEDGDAHFLYSWSLLWLDARFEEARTHARRALEINPVDPWFQALQNWVCYFSRDYEGAIREARRLVEQHPHWAMGHYVLGSTLATAGNGAEAIPSIDRSIELDGRGVQQVGWLGMACAVAGRRAEAMHCLRELEARAREGATVWAWELVVQAGLGDAEQVMRCLEDAYEQRSSALLLHLIHPLVDCVRTDPRFIDLLRRMNLDHLVSYRPEKPWSPPAAATSTSAPEALDTPSIAVLPFTNMSADPEQEYFCDGMAEEIINALSPLDGMRVVARTSAFAFKGKHKDVREIGRQLGVTHLLEGSVRKGGTRLRITTQLTTVSDGYQLWSQRFERSMEDVFAVQDEISSAIVERLSAELKGRAPARPAAERRPRNLAAYDAYLRGRFHWAKGTLEGYRQSIECFEAAVAEDPRYALAYAGLSDAHTWFAFLGSRPSTETSPTAKAAALEAIGLDGELAEAHTSLGSIKFYFDWDWDGAEREFRRAIELNARSTVALQAYAVFLGNLGRVEDAIETVERALELDPLWSKAHQDLGLYLCWGKRYDDAIAQLNRAIEIDPQFLLTHLCFGFTHLETGDYASAIEAFERGAEMGGGSFFEAGLAIGYARSGSLTDALAILRRLQAEPEGSRDPVHIAWVLASLGETASALDSLEEAYAQRAPMLTSMPSFPWWDPLRAEPRFQAIVRRMNFPDAAPPA